MLNDLVLPSYVYRTVDEEGSDSIKSRIKDKVRFLNWPTVTYQYNSRGFRDLEWPEDVTSCIWCVGDSFTVGVGNNFDETWPYILGQRLNQRTINVSMNGASNDWISRRSRDIITELSPEILIVHWTFIHRREDSDVTKPDDQRRIWHKTDTESLNNSQELNVKNLVENISKLEQHKAQTEIIHSFIPAYSKEPKVNGRRTNTESAISKLNLAHVIPEFDILDYGRDEIHYHVQTANFFVDKLEEKISSIKNTISNIRTL